MNIQETNRTDTLLTVQVVVETTDYSEKVEETLRQYRKQVSLPGFRKGMVPSSLVRKQYGASVLYQEVTRKAYDELMEYIQTLQLHTFGMPMLVKTNLSDEVVSLDTDYELTFDVGVVPNIQFDFAKLPTLHQYSVTVTDADVDEALELQSYRHGERTSIGAVGTDVYEIAGVFNEVDEAGSVVPNGVMLTLDFITLHYKHFQQKLAGKQVGDKVETTLADFFGKDATGRNVMQITQEVYEQLKHKPMHFTINSIQHVKPVEVGEPLLKILAPAREFTTLEDFKKEYKEGLERAYSDRAEAKFRTDVHQGLLDQLTFELPVQHIERMLLTQFEDIHTVEELRQKHPNYLLDFKLYILHERLKHEFPQIAVRDEDIESHARESVKGWFQQFMPQTAAAGDSSSTVAEEGAPEAVETATEGNEDTAETADMADSPFNEAAMDGLVQRLLGDKEYLERNQNEIQARKIFDFLKDQYNIQQTAITKQSFDEI